MTRTRGWTFLLVVLFTSACAEDVVPPSSMAVASTASATVPPLVSPPPPGATSHPATTGGSVQVTWVPPGPLGNAIPIPRPCPTTTTSSDPNTRKPSPSTGCEPHPPLPADAATPAWKAAFASRDCAAIGALGVGVTTQLYRGLRLACTAAADNDPAEWEAARKALDAVNGSPTCPDRLALGLLTRLVEAHQHSPEARLRFVESTVAPSDACR